VVKTPYLFEISIVFLNLSSTTDLSFKAYSCCALASVTSLIALLSFHMNAFSYAISYSSFFFKSLLSIVIYFSSFLDWGLAITGGGGILAFSGDGVCGYCLRASELILLSRPCFSADAFCSRNIFCSSSCCCVRSFYLSDSSFIPFNWSCIFVIISSIWAFFCYSYSIAAVFSCSLF